MFCVEQRFAGIVCQVLDGFRDVVGVVLQADPERFADVEVMGFTDKTDRGGVCIEHRCQYVVVFSRPPCPFGHSKGGHGGFRLGGLVEEG